MAAHGLLLVEVSGGYTLDSVQGSFSQHQGLFQ